MRYVFRHNYVPRIQAGYFKNRFGSIEEKYEYTDGETALIHG